MARASHKIDEVVVFEEPFEEVVVVLLEVVVSVRNKLMQQEIYIFLSVISVLYHQGSVSSGKSYSAFCLETQYTKFQSGNLVKRDRGCFSETELSLPLSHNYRCFRIGFETLK